MKKRIGIFNIILDNEIINKTLIFVFFTLPIIVAMKASKDSLKIILIEFILYFLIYFLLGKNILRELEPKATFNEKYYREVPKMKPAIFRYLLYGCNMKDYIDFKATILDLINRDYLAISKINEEYILKKNDKKEELCVYEEKVIEWLFKDSNEIYCKDIKNNLKKDKFSGYKLEGWKNIVVAETQKHQYKYINEKKQKLINTIGAFAIILYVLEIIIAICSKSVNINMIFYVFISLFMTIDISFIDVSLDKYSLNIETLNEIEKAKALKRYIEDYSLLDERKIEDIEIWEGYMVYAYTLSSSNEINKLFDKIIGNEIYKVK